MIKNLKIDIVYYNTSSDFEFEFNLGGYCRSRILNAKANNLKEMLTKLAVAVTRSRVIIIVGELLGDNGCIAPVAKAISKPLVSVDHRSYHITSPEPINIIDGSLPLVSKDGDFGGCIIESGPQSIIFLTEDKSLRNRISEELVADYLSSLSITSDEENKVIENEDTVTDTIPAPIEETPIPDEGITLPENEVSGENAQEETITEDVAEEIADDNIAEEDVIEFTEESDLETSEESEPEVDSEAEPVIDIFEETQEQEEPETVEERVTENVDIFEDLDTMREDQDNTEETGEEAIEEETVIIPNIPTETNLDNAYISNTDDDDEYDDFDDYCEKPKKEKKKRTPLSALSKSLIILLAVLFVIIAAIVYFAVYLPSLNGFSIIEFIKSILEI